MIILLTSWCLTSFKFCNLFFFLVVRALVPRMTLDELFEQKGEVAKAVLEELEKVSELLLCSIYC